MVAAVGWVFSVLMALVFCRSRLFAGEFVAALVLAFVLYFFEF